MLRRAVTTTRTLLEEAMAERILVLDGAMGTTIHRRKLTEEQVRGGSAAHTAQSLEDVFVSVTASEDYTAMARQIFDIVRCA